MNTPEELSVEEGYTRWAPLYDGDGNPLVALEGPLIESWIGDIRGRRVLDLGCGTGRHTRVLIDSGGIVTAADRTEAMMARARDNLRGSSVAWIRASLPGPLPFPARTFSLVVMGLVAEHLEDLAGALREVTRILEPGGRTLLSALHPARTRAGQKARFIDPETGERRPILTVHREVEEYLAAASGAGLTLIEERALHGTEELARRLPRALPYVDQPLGWAARFVKE